MVGALRTACTAAAVGLACLPASAGADEPTQAVNLEYTAVPRIAADAPGAQLGDPAGAGDVNGDGRGDVIAALNPPARNETARLRVVFTQPPAGRMRLSRQPGFDIFMPPGAFRGVRYAAAGDVNADGLADVVVTRLNEVYVVFGSPSGDAVQLSQPGARGFAVTGMQGTPGGLGPIGFAVGDVNGDGVDDLGLGSPASDPAGRTDAGSAFVLYGSRDMGAADAGTLGLRGFRIDGAEAGDHLGLAGAGVGDVNGDGHADVGLSGDRKQPESPDDPVWIVTGGAPGITIDLAAPTAPASRTAGAASDYDVPLAGAGDVNGDGLADTLLASESTKRFHLLLGSREGGEVDLNAGSARVVTLNDTSGRVAAGYFVVGPGDLTGDGAPDIVVGGPYSGGAFVVRGGRDLPQSLDLLRLGARGFELGGARGASRLGDVDGDGRADLLLPAASGFRCNPSSSASGSAYLASGATLPPEVLAHGFFTRAADRLTGTPDSDVIFGDRGNDRLSGGDGDDCLRGGQDDVFEATNDFYAPRPDNDTLFGGRGDDLLDGGAANDVLSGGPGDDLLEGAYGRDRVLGGDGDDRIQEEIAEFVPGGRDVIDAGRGNDRIFAADNSADRIDCGPGRDTAAVDREDRVRHCERVRRYR